MRRWLERRLARLEAAFAQTRAATAEAEEAQELHEAIIATIRIGLVRAGLDPGEAVALRRATLPEPQPTPAVAPPDPVPPDSLVGRMLALAQRYRDKGMPRPNLAQASLAELFAFCIADAAPA
jgi:hypothetical protein